MKSNYLTIGLALTIGLVLIIYFLVPFDLADLHEGRAVKVYYADNMSPAHQIVIDNFNKKYVGQIEVVPIDLPFTKFSTNERKELLTRSLRSKSDRLDLFAVDLIWVSRFAKWSEPLDKYFSIHIQDKFLKYSLEACSYENQLVAIPTYIDIGIMYYRRDLINSLPNRDEIIQKLEESITWEEFISLKKHFDTDKNPYYIFTADDYEGLICSFSELLLSIDENYFNKNAISLDNSTARKALQFLVDLVNKYKISPQIITDMRENSSYDYFNDNKGVFLRGWPSFDVVNKRKFDKGNNNDSLGIAALPHFKDGNTVSVFGGWNLMISKFSKNKNEVIEFVNYMISEESQKILYEENGFLPILKSFYSDEEFLKHHPNIKLFNRLLSNGAHRPFIEDYTRISDIMSHYVKRAILKEITVENALIEATDLIISNKVLIK